MQAGFGEGLPPAHHRESEPARVAARHAESWRIDFDATSPDTTSASAIPRAIAGARRFGRSFDERAAVFGSLGFICGMVVWHVVGFWAFVSDVVLNAPGTEAVRPQPVEYTKTTASPSANTAQITTGSITTAGSATRPAPAPREPCLALELDRHSGATRTTACPDDDNGLRDAGYQRRADRTVLTPRLENPTAWATGTQMSPETHAQAPTVSETDFNLEIRADP